MNYNAGIIGMGIGLPDKVLTNRDLEQMVETNDEWIRTRTGISERRIAEANIATSDLATTAAVKALEMSGIESKDLDLIIVATVTPDMMFPSTATIVQNNIGAVNAAAFDLEAACTGFIYGLTIASQFIKTGTYKNVLVIGCDILSKITDFTDRNTCILFGDGAGAAVVSRTEENGIVESYLGADGSGGKHLYVPAGGSRMPVTAETLEKKLGFTAMEGSEVFKFAVKAMPDAVNKVLEKAGLGIENLDYMIPHQANIRIIDSAARRLGFSMDRVGLTISKYGNMSSASIPITLLEEYEQNKIKKGDKIVLVGFGAGLTYGAALITWLI